MALPVATLQQLEAAVVTVCNQTWSEVSQPLGLPALIRSRGLGEPSWWGSVVSVAL